MSSKKLQKSGNQSAHIVKGKSRNTRVAENLNGDLSKTNWRDKEIRDEIKNRGLFELFPNTFIEKEQVEMIETLISMSLLTLDQ
jgi:hypothetical protein